MDCPGFTGSHPSSLYPPTTYTSPVVDCLVRLQAFFRRTGCITVLGDESVDQTTAAGRRREAP